MKRKQGKELQSVIKKESDINKIDFTSKCSRKIIIVSEDHCVIASCIKCIVNIVKNNNIKSDDITVVITNSRMINKLDEQSNKKFSNILFKTSN